MVHGMIRCVKVKRWKRCCNGQPQPFESVNTKKKIPYDTARKIIITHLHWRNEWNICTTPLPKLFQWSQSSAFRSKSALTLVLGEVKVWGEGRRLIFRYHPASLHCRYFIVGGASKHYKLGGGGHGLREDFVPPPHPPHSPHCLPHISHDVSSGNIILDQSLIP